MDTLKLQIKLQSLDYFPDKISFYRSACNRLESDKPSIMLAKYTFWGDERFLVAEKIIECEETLGKDQFFSAMYVDTKLDPNNALGYTTECFIAFCFAKEEDATMFTLRY